MFPQTVRSEAVTAVWLAFFAGSYWSMIVPRPSFQTRISPGLRALA